MSSLDSFAAGKLARMEAHHLRRIRVDSAREDGIWIVQNGRKFLSFSCNDYLNLSQHPKVKAAAVAAIEAFGVGAGASRLVTGNHPLFAELEARLAKLKGTEAACVFGSGYLANTGIIPALVRKTDLVLVDELAHACIWSGAELSGADVVSFKHNDVADAGNILAERRTNYRHALIATDGVFSMDGDLAPLHDLAALAKAHDAWLMSDDAHGVGVVGGGRGSAFIDGKKADVPLQMGTLSKAVGGYGGYLCASAPVIDFIKTRARTLIYSTGLPPATVAAAIAALDIITSDQELINLPLIKARNFTRRLNLPYAVSPIVPIVIGDPEQTLAAQRLLEDEGFLVSAIRPPTVPMGTSRLRVTFTAAHPDDEIARLADVIRTKVLAA